MHFDEERGTLVYYIAQTTDEQMQYFKDAMANAGINIKMARNMLTVTPKSIDGPVTLPQDVESLNAVIESLTLDDISINNPKYKEKQEEENELIAKKAKGKYASEVTPRGASRLSKDLQRKSLSSHTRRVDYNHEFFTFDQDDEQEYALATLAWRYARDSIGLASKEVNEEGELESQKLRDDLSTVFTSDVIDSMEGTKKLERIPFPSGKDDWIYLIKINIAALSAIAEKVDEELGSNTLKMLRGRATLVRVIGAIVGYLTPPQDEGDELASSWVFNAPDMSEVKVFQTKGAAFYLRRFGIDSTWRASTPLGDGVRTVGINT